MFDGHRYSATARTKPEARTLRLEKIDAIRSGEANDKTKAETLAGFLARYLTRKRGRVDPSTYASYALAVDHLTEGFGNVRLAALADPQTVLDAYDALAARLAPATLARAHLTLKQALRYAAEEGQRVPVIPKHIRPPRRDTEPARAMPLPQLRAFLAAALDDAPMWHALWTLALYAGLRLGELLALRWEDVTARSVSVRQALGEDAEGTPRLKPYPKTSAGVRTVPLPREVTALLEAHRARQLAPHALVFCNREGGPLLKSSASHAFQRAWRLAKNPGRAHPHLLRHTYAKSQFDLGVSLPKIAARMGHADGSTTLRLYAHFRRDEDDEEPRALVDYYYGSAAMPATKQPETAGMPVKPGTTTNVTTDATPGKVQLAPTTR
jgi:integrase